MSVASNVVPLKNSTLLMPLLSDALADNPTAAGATSPVVGETLRLTTGGVFGLTAETVTCAKSCPAERTALMSDEKRGSLVGQSECDRNSSVRGVTVAQSYPAVHAAIP